MEGYNIGTTVDGKTLLGRTQDTLTISAITKESLTKADQGAKRVAVTGHDITFRMAGIVEVSASSQTSVLTSDEVLALALKKGDEAVIPLTYFKEGGATYEGVGVITGYSEDSAAEGDPTYSLDIKVSGELTLKTA